jgi:electron transfer flavoprotein beta subunit
VHIVVLIKQVPESEAMIQLHADGSGIDIEDRYCLNFFDSLAVEEALRIKEQLGSGTVTAITLGSQKSIEVLRTAIAMGADDAILLTDPAFASGDEYATAKALTAALKKRDYDLIFCGREAFDDSSGIVGPLVAEFLGIPHVTSVIKLNISAEKETAIIERQIENGKEIIRTPLPVLLAAQKGLNEPRVSPVMGGCDAGDAGRGPKARARCHRPDGGRGGEGGKPGGDRALSSAACAASRHHDAGCGS